MSDPVRISPKALQIDKEGATRGRWYVRVPVEHTLEDVLAPEYFGNASQGQKPLRVPDVIEIEPEDLSWLLEVTVTSVNPVTRRVVTRLRGEVQTFGVEVSEAQKAAGYSLKFIGKEAAWAILDKNDAIIDQNHKTAAAALEKLNEIMPPLKAKKAA